MKCKLCFLRVLLLILVFSMLLSCYYCSSFAEEPELQAIQEEINYQALAVGLAAWLNGVGSDWQKGWQSELVLWDAAGWYSALQNRVYDQKLLGEEISSSLQLGKNTASLKSFTEQEIQ